MQHSSAHGPPQGLPPGSFYAWISSFRVEWRWFAHFTFEREVGAEAAQRRFRRWIRRVSRAVYGARKGRQRLVRHVAVAERHSTRDGYHLHCVVADVDGLDRIAFRDRWTAGLARIDRYEPALDGLRYALKQADCSDVLVVIADEIQLPPEAA